MLDRDLSHVKIKLEEMAEARKRKKEYHHGDLRRAVLEAAFAEVAERGLRELTLREVARKIGVTHAAPYHHFKDREALIEAMAEEAFSELDRALSASKVGVSAAGDQLRVVGRAYIDFARARPELIEVMFRRSGKGSYQPESEVGKRAFQHLVDAVIDCQTHGLAPTGDPFQIALAAWSLVHGFSALWLEGPLSSMGPYTQAFEQLRDRIVDDFSTWLRAAATAPKLL